MECDLPVEVTLLHFCNILVAVQVSPVPRGNGYQRAGGPAVQNHLEPSWVPPTTDTCLTMELPSNRVTGVKHFVNFNLLFKH